MIGYLKDVFSDVLMLALSAIITSIVLKYICKFLKLRLAIWLYQKSLDRPNIIYLVKEIVKPKYKDLAFLVPDISETSTIPKIMIFINSMKRSAL